MRAGQLDRQITIQQATRTRGATGAVSESWADVISLRAGIKQRKQSELEAAAKTQARGELVFITRFVSGITPLNRLLFETRAYDITGVVETGRRAGLEITAMERV